MQDILEGELLLRAHTQAVLEHAEDEVGHRSQVRWTFSEAVRVSPRLQLEGAVIEAVLEGLPVALSWLVLGCEEKSSESDSNLLINAVSDVLAMVFCELQVRVPALIILLTILRIMGHDQIGV